MTRDEAIKELELIAKVTIWNDRREAVEMAIEALTYQNLSKPNNTCEVDLISREDAMGAVQDHFNADGFKGYYDGQTPTIDAKPRLASRWIDADLDPNFAKCKKCSEHKVDIAYRKDFIKQERWNFCPYCGAEFER